MSSVSGCEYWKALAIITEAMILATVRSSENAWRGPALVVILVATLCGLFGTYVASLAVLFALDDVETASQRYSAFAFIAFYGSLLACPLMASIIFGFRRYRLAMMIASAPLLLVALSAVVAIFS
ncbi:hypothetical protein [Brevundimonas nasdae]|nr:hypothetical protein [Brevundimonas nasdae]